MVDFSRYYPKKSLTEVHKIVVLAVLMIQNSSNDRMPLFSPTARQGYIFTGVYLSTIGLMDTGSLLGLVTVRSVRILLECFLVCNLLVIRYGFRNPLSTSIVAVIVKSHLGVVNIFYDITISK